MELHLAKLFVEVAATGNLTEAAARLHTSQPAASAHLKALEQHVGFPLFFRTARGMTLTEQGAGLLPEARALLEAARLFDHKAHTLRSVPSRPLRIGLNTDGQLLRVPLLLERLAARLSEAEPHLIETKSEHTAADLESGKISAGFFYGDPDDFPSVHTLPLTSYPMVVVYPREWVPAKIGLKPNLEDFADKPWIWTTQGCPFYRKSLDYFQKRGLTPHRVLYVDDEALIGKLVYGGIGCSLLAEPAARSFEVSGLLQVWNGLDLRISLNFGYAKSEKNDPLLVETGRIVEGLWRE